MTQATAEKIPSFVNTVITALGGRGKLKAMIAAEQFVYDEKKQEIRFKFKGCKHYNCVVYRQDGNDPGWFEVDYWKIPTNRQIMNGAEIPSEPVRHYFPIWVGELKGNFEYETGLLLSL